MSTSKKSQQSYYIILRFPLDSQFYIHWTISKFEPGCLLKFEPGGLLKFEPGCLLKFEHGCLVKFEPGFKKMGQTLRFNNLSNNCILADQKKGECKNASNFWKYF